MFRDASENNIEKNKELPEEFVDDDGVESLPKEISIDEIDESQCREIKETFEKIANKIKLTDAEKGNLGEMLMDQYYISQGYVPIHSPRVTDLKHKSGQGIDGVYEKTDFDGSKEYVIADAKVNFSKLNKGLADGTNQMSDVWVEKRLDNAVGKEKADEIRDAYEDDSNSVSKVVYHLSYADSVKEKSKSDLSTVDSDGKQEKDSVVVQFFDINGNEIGEV